MGKSTSTAKRITSIFLAALLFVSIVALIATCVQRGSLTRRNMEIKHVTQKATRPQTVPHTTPSQGGNVSKDNYFPSLKSDYYKNHKYAIAVNTAQNIVTVYTRNASTGKYTVPYKAFICSVGKKGGTRSGTWYTNEKCGHWHALIGNVYGQWATRIHDGILFHSVPYYKADPSTLETEEYNKLGTVASAGCVRMTVADVKWIYDNCPLGTVVTVYYDPNVQEPLPKPTAQKIPLNSPNKGWDPTDPDSRNPWKK